MDENVQTAPDHPDFGWSGDHVLTDGSLGAAMSNPRPRPAGLYRCSCGRGDWGSVTDVQTHIEWALREQNKALWNAGQRVCNGSEGAMEQLGQVLDWMRPLPAPSPQGASE